MVRTHRLAVACAFLVACALSACGGEKATSVSECTTNAACPAGQVCTGTGRCICESDAGCSSRDGGTDGGSSGSTDSGLPATLTAIAVAPFDTTLALGLTQQFTATGTYSDGSTQVLTNSAQWSTSDNTLATISSSGLVQSVATGTVTITAKDGVISGTAQLTIGQASFVSLTVMPSTGSIPVGATLQLTATGTLTDGTMEDLTSAVTWNTSNSAVAGIAPTGLVTAVGPGLATLTASDGNVSATAAISVTSAVLKSISVTPTNPTIVLGQMLQMTATGVFTDGSTMDLTSMGAQWSIDMTAVASISQTGAVQSLTQGTATISAVYMAFTGSTLLTVMPATLDSISVTPANPSVAAGDSLALTATGSFSDGSKMDVTGSVTWRSSQTSVATIAASGELLGVSAGTTVVSAKLDSKTGTTNVTVTPPQLSAVSITPADPMMSVGTSTQLIATGTYTDSSMQPLTSGVSWKSSNTQVATISATGLVHAVAVGTITVTATDNGISGTTTVTVGMATLVSIVITPANSTVPLGATSQLTATGTFSDGSKGNVSGLVSWQSSSTAIANISTTGIVTAEATGSVTISATDGAVMASTSLTVGPPTLASIQVNPSGQTISKGTTLQLSATGTYTDGSTQNVTGQVTWTASSNGVLTVVNGGTQTGLATAAAVGTGTVTAAVGTISGSVQIGVTVAVPVSLAVSPANASIPIGATQMFVATATLTDNSTTNVTTSAMWTSSAAAILQIQSPGAAIGQQAGTAVVTATSGAFSATSNVTVAALTSLTVTPNGASIPAGTTQQLDAVGTFANGAMLDLTNVVTWTSSDTAVATVNAQGLVTGVMQGTGPVTIFATDGMISSSVTLTVGPAALVSIAVGPTQAGTPFICSDGLPTLDLPETEQMTAEGIYTDGSMKDVSSVVTWTSSNLTLATVSATGLVAPIGVGMVTITATLDNVSGTYDLSLLGPTAITVSGNSQPVPAGETITLVANGTYADGTTQFVSVLAAWSTSDSRVFMTTSTPGVVSATGTAQEQATITAALGGVSGTAVVTVSSAVLVSIAVTPANQTISQGSQLQLAAIGTYSDNRTTDLTSVVTWGSTAGTIAGVDTAGLVTANIGNVGNPQIVATDGAIAGLTTVNVQ